MVDAVDKFFSGLEDQDKSVEFYPGSKKQRRESIIPPPASSAEPWEGDYFLKTINGSQVRMYTIGSLAKAIRRSSNSVRSWIRLGYIPNAPWRLPSYEVDGQTVPGRRLWSRSMVDSLVFIFASHDLLDKKRVEWKRYPDIPALINKEWERIYADMTAPRENKEN